MKKSRSIVITLGIALLMISLAAFISSESAEVHAATGYGSAASPYLIKSEADWNEFVQNVNSGNSYNGRIVRLANDITVSRMAGKSDHVFRGTFDGDGHTLTFNYTSREQYTAPFRYVDGAVFFNLTVSGTINTEQKFAGGFIGRTKGNVMLVGCRSSVTINSSVEGDGTHGGFLAETRGSSSIFINCLFDGAISGSDTNSCGGFIGWAEYGGISIINSFFAGRMSTYTRDCETFARGNGIGEGSFKNAFYKSAYNGPQGTQTDKTGEALKEQLGEGWTVSGENVIPKKADMISGDGTDASPYLIQNELNWTEFAHRVKSGTTYWGKTIKLTSDITVDSMAGDSDHRFGGTFDGDGHTIMFNLKTGGKYAAPFRFVSGAAFYNLNVNGTVETSDQCAAGIVGNSTGEVAFVSCRSSINLRCSRNGNATHGGFIAEAKGPLTIFKDCLFDGSISGDQTTSCSGFVGWPGDNSRLSFINCLSNGTYFTKKEGDSFYDCGTFTRVNKAENVSINKCFYKTVYGAEQGTKTDKSGSELKSMLGDGWTIDGDQVIPGKVPMEGLEGDGTAKSPYLIKNEQDWEFVARSVNNGNHFGGKVLKLTGDILISAETMIAPMIGNAENPFKGVFDGNGHTITFNCKTSDSYAAPFRCVEDASIYNLTVNGTIETSAQLAAGIISKAKGDTSLVSCRSSININSSVSGNGTHGGFIAEATDGYEHYYEFTDCLFDGEISGNQTTECGGFLGWLGDNNTAVFSNCLNEGAFSTGKNDSQEFIGCATFSRGSHSDKIILNNSYYRTAYGTAQGTQTSATGNELREKLGDGWIADGNKVIPKTADTSDLDLNGVVDYDVIRFSGIDWVVVDADHTNGYATEEEYQAGGRKSPGMFLLSKETFGYVHYAAAAGDVYEGSIVQNECTKFYNEKIKDPFKTAIMGVKTNADDIVHGSRTCNIDGLRSNSNTDKVFLLSALEYERYNVTRANSPSINRWWLRSVSASSEEFADYYYEGELKTYFRTESSGFRPAMNINLDKLIFFENPEYSAGGPEPKWIVKSFEGAIADDKEDLQAAVDKAKKKRDYVAIGYTNGSKEAVTDAVSEAVDCIETNHVVNSVNETEAVLAEIAAKKAAVEKAAAELTVENYVVPDSEYTIKAGDEICADGVDLKASEAAGKGYFGNPMFRVLKVEDGRMLLMSEYLWGGGKGSASSGTLCFNSNGGSAWQSSDAQAWGSAFNDDILSQITGLKVNNVPANTTDKAYSPAADQIKGEFTFGESKNILTTDDKVFFLSGEETLEFMKVKDQRIAKIYSDNSVGDEAAWWLRSPVKDSTEASRITTDGSAAMRAADKGNYLRPVFWADMPEIDPSLISMSTKDVEGTARTVYTINIPHKHVWGEATYEWADDNSRVTAKRICKTDPEHVEEETVNTTSEITKAAACEAKGITTYTASFENAGFEQQTKEVENIPAPGHKWGEPVYSWADDNSTVTARRVCTNDPKHVEEETVETTSEATKEATCEQKGEIKYTAEFKNKAFEAQTKTVEDIDARGHDYRFVGMTWTKAAEGEGYTVKANFVCKRDAEHTNNIDAAVTSEKTDSTCQAAGIITYTAKATFDGMEYTDTKSDGIEVKAHSWGEPTYKWSDDGSVCIAKRACTNDGCDAVETEPGEVTSEEKTPATCEAKGTTTYTAAFKGAGFEQQTKDVEDIPALGHKWGAPTYNWSADKNSVTAKRICENDPEHVEEETVETTSEVETPATCESKGKTKYTAVFENEAFEIQTETVDNIDALGHDYGYVGMTWTESEDGEGYSAKASFVCSHDAEHVQDIDAEVTKETIDSTCQEEGIITYTATVEFEGKTDTDSRQEGIDKEAHEWGKPTYTWSNDGSLCIGEIACMNEGCNAFETEIAEISSEVMVPATYEAKGKTIYTATFNNEAFEAQTKDIEDIPVIERDPAAKTALDRINGLPEIEEITTADKTAIERARKVYDNLTEEEKKSLPAGTLEKLQKAETALGEAQRIAEEEAAEKKAEEEAAKKKAADAKAKKVKTVTVNVKTVNANAINKAVKKAGGSSEYVTKIVLGKKVKKISNGAFKSYKKVKTLEVKTKKLKKKTVKRSLKGSKITKVEVKVGKKTTNKKYIKKYRKIFTKKNCGRKVSVR